MATKRLDIDRERAVYALQCVNQRTGNYGSYIESLPMMLHNSGLRNTLAFAYAKGYLKDKPEQGWKRVFDHLINWFRTEPTNFIPALKTKSESDLLEYIITLEDEASYRFLTQETYALLNWLRKLVKGDSENKNNNQDGA